MNLVDANLLLYAADRASPHQGRAGEWLEDQLNGDVRVGIPWESFLAFVRISTHPRVMAHPLTASAAWGHVQDWLDAPATWIPAPTERHADVLGQLLTRHRVTGNLVHDAHIAAIALQHGLAICSADSDFARFPEVTWHNPIADR